MTKSESDAQKALEDKAKGLFETAKPYLELAHQTQPEDVETMRSLRDIYARTGDDDKMIDINNKLKATQE